jgi:hypothetical protein
VLLALYRGLLGVSSRNFNSCLSALLQVKTIDTPRVRPLPQTELKKRQAAVDAYEVATRKGALVMVASFLHQPVFCAWTRV